MNFTKKNKVPWVKFQVLTVASMKVTVFWDVEPCLVENGGLLAGLCLDLASTVCLFRSLGYKP
jgi:predicted Kef-type K+ transport protein